jgi:hypothetical protein
MAWPLAHQDRDLVDVPISDLRATQKGRQALAGGEFGPMPPGFDPELAPDILFAVACWEDSYAATGAAS